MDRVRRGLLVGALLGVLVAVGLFLSPLALVDRFRWLLFSPWFPLVLVGLYLVRPAVAWPIAAISVLVGVRYGFAAGLPIALVGAILTSLPAYVAGRSLRSEEGLLGRATAGSERFFHVAGGLRGVAAARLAPTPAEAVSAAAGAARVPVAAFVAGTAIGELPWTVAAVLAGSSVRRLGSAGPATDPRLVLAGLLAAALVLAGPAYRVVRRRWATGG